MNAIQPEKLKVIDNYQLESQIFQSIHLLGCNTQNPEKIIYDEEDKINRSRYWTLQNTELSLLKKSIRGYSDDDSANILKRINLDFKPKFQKIIRTNAHIYSIYDEFQGSSLSKYLQSTCLSLKQRLVLTLNIAKQLQILHCQGVCLLYLTKDSINIVESSKVLFVDWTLATYINQLSNTIPYVKTFYEDLANILELNPNSAFSIDIFNLAKICQFILEQKQENTPNKLQETLTLILNEKSQSKISLKDIIKVLDECIANIRQDRSLIGSSRSRGKYEENKQSSLMINKGFKLKIKHSQSAEDTISTFKMRDKSRQFSNNQQVIDLPSYNYGTKEQSLSKARKTISTAHQSKQSNRIKSTSPFGKHTDSESPSAKNEIYQKGLFINKMRNLSYFLLNLHEFVFQKDLYPELSYMLLKKAHFCAKQALHKAKALFIDSQKIIQSKLINILTLQTQKISSLLGIQKQICKGKNNQPAFVRQLEYERITDEQYFNKKIKQFAKQELQKCGIMNPKQINKSLDNLFQTYLLVKKLEYQSYQKFWEEIYKPNIAHLSNQPYFSNQKRLGFRYIRQKLLKIVQK